MTQSHALDLRVRVAGFVEAGHSRRAAARHFGVSDSFAIKLMQRQRQFGSAAPARQGRPRGTGKLALRALSRADGGGRAGHHHAGTCRKARSPARRDGRSVEPVEIPVQRRLHI